VAVEMNKSYRRRKVKGFEEVGKELMSITYVNEEGEVWE